MVGGRIGQVGEQVVMDLSGWVHLVGRGDALNRWLRRSLWLSKRCGAPGYQVVKVTAPKNGGLVETLHTRVTRTIS